MLNAFLRCTGSLIMAEFISVGQNDTQLSALYGRYVFIPIVFITFGCV
jgi:hypothetical protein